jgi:hypothetical protein
MLLQKISFPIVFALPEVLLHETFGTVLNSASHADDWVIVGEDIPRAFLIKAEYFMRIFFDRVSDQNVVIFFPILDCQISDDFWIHFQWLRTAFLWALYFLEIHQLSVDVGVNTALTEGVPAAVTEANQLRWQVRDLTDGAKWLHLLFAGMGRRRALEKNLMSFSSQRLTKVRF